MSKQNKKETFHPSNSCLGNILTMSDQCIILVIPASHLNSLTLWGLPLLQAWQHSQPDGFTACSFDHCIPCDGGYEPCEDLHCAHLEHVPTQTLIMHSRKQGNKTDHARIRAWWEPMLTDSINHLPQCINPKSSAACDIPWPPRIEEFRGCSEITE